MDSDNAEQMHLKAMINKCSRWEHLVTDLLYRKKISLMDYMKFMSILYMKCWKYENELKSYTLL